jgi:predicted nucleotidyltransferase
MANALFSATQQRVLALLFGQPERSYFATELIALTKSGSGAVQRELKRLQESGLVTVTRKGRQKHFQANRTAPLFEELRSIVIKTVGLADPLRAALKPLSGDIRLAVVYGSVARGSDTARSDVDLLVVSDELNLEQIYRVLDPVESRLARKVNPTLYTSAEFDQRREVKSPFITNILGQEHIVLVGNLDGDTGAR